MANSHRSHESNADEMHPIQTVTKTKMVTLAMHRSKKLYVHASIKNEALLDAKMEWGRMTPSPNEIVVGKSEAKRSDKKRQQTCRQLSLPLIKNCRLLSLEIVASCRLYSVISSHFNFHLLPAAVSRNRDILPVDDRNGTTKRRRQTIPQRPGTTL